MSNGSYKSAFDSKDFATDVLYEVKGELTREKIMSLVPKIERAIGKPRKGVLEAVLTEMFLRSENKSVPSVIRVVEIKDANDDSERLSLPKKCIVADVARVRMVNGEPKWCVLTLAFGIGAVNYWPAEYQVSETDQLLVRKDCFPDMEFLPPLVKVVQKLPSGFKIVQASGDLHDKLNLDFAGFVDAEAVGPESDETRKSRLFVRYPDESHYYLFEGEQTPAPPKSLLMDIA